MDTCRLDTALFIGLFIASFPGLLTASFPGLHTIQHLFTASDQKLDRPKPETRYEYLSASSLIPRPLLDFISSHGKEKQIFISQLWRKPQIFLHCCEIKSGLASWVNKLYLKSHSHSLSQLLVLVWGLRWKAGWVGGWPGDREWVLG